MQKLKVSEHAQPTPEQLALHKAEEQIRVLTKQSEEAKRSKTYWMDEAQRRREELDTALATKLHNKPIVIKPRLSTHTSETTAILALSDWHVEETVDPDTVNGKNEYNLEIADRRIRRVFEKAHLLTNIWRNHTKIETLVMPFLGDFITGYIHEELQEGNSLSPTEAVLWVQKRLIGGIQMMLEETKFKRIVVPCNFGNHGRCHDDQTELLTREGWKTYDQLRVGELVPTYKMDGTGKTEWQPLQDVYVDNYDGEMIYGKTSSLDFAVTPKHRMVTVAYHNDKPGFQHMEDVLPGTIGNRYLPRCAFGTDTDMPDITDDELRLLGWLQSDGSLAGEIEHGMMVKLYQSKPAMVEVIRALLGRMNIEYTENPRHRDPPIIKGVRVKTCLPETTFYIRASAHRRITELITTREAIPVWMYDLSERQVNIWLEAMCMGDANGNSDEYCELYGSKEWMSAVQALLLVNGRAARLRMSNRGDWSLSLRTTHKTFLQNWDTTITKRRYVGKIWCGTVANGTLITRRNGVPLISGNTTAKPRVSSAAHNSYEWLMYHNIANTFETLGEKRVEFKIESGYHNYVDIYGRTLRCHHGDWFKYAEGVGGIAIPVNKGILRWNKTTSAWMDLFGHWHQFKDDGSWICNPSLIGYNAYAIKIKAPFELPSQTMVFVEKTHGKTATLPIWADTDRLAR